MELFADSILPDFGLKRVESHTDRAVRLRKERDEQQRKDAAAAAAAAAAARDDAARIEALRRAKQLHLLNADQLAQEELSLSGAAPGTPEDDVRRAVTLQLNRADPRDARFARRDAAIKSGLIIGPQTVQSEFGTVTLTQRATTGIVGAAGIIGGATAPKKKGGAAGIATATRSSPAGLPVDDVTQLDRLFAANPPDP